MSEGSHVLLDELDASAEALARRPVDGTSYTEEILLMIGRLYQTAKDETRFKDEYFECAYHAPVTGDVEFFLARLFYRYSKANDLEWKIYLRRQVGKVAPDIRIECKDQTIAVIEVKAKVGFQQCCFSKERYDYDLEMFRSEKSKVDPDALIEKFRNQFQKYQQAFDLPASRVFLFLPSLGTAHRKKYSSGLADYYRYVSSTSSLPTESLIILSNNLSLNLSNERSTDLQPTNNFERMLLAIHNPKVAG